MAGVTGTLALVDGAEQMVVEEWVDGGGEQVTGKLLLADGVQ